MLIYLSLLITFLLQFLQGNSFSSISPADLKLCCELVTDSLIFPGWWWTWIWESLPIWRHRSKYSVKSINLNTWCFRHENWPFHLSPVTLWQSNLPHRVIVVWKIAEGRNIRHVLSPWMIYKNNFYFIYLFIKKFIRCPSCSNDSGRLTA